MDADSWDTGSSPLVIGDIVGVCPRTTHSSQTTNVDISPPTISYNILLHMQ